MLFGLLHALELGVVLRPLRLELLAPPLPFLLFLVFHLIRLPDLHSQPGIEFCQVQSFVAVGLAVLLCPL